MFGFVHWFRASTVTGTRATYHVVFTGSVGGLRKGSTVEFNGMRVGEVADLQLDKRDPKQVIATISVDSNVPIRNDTYVRLEFTGLTGVASVALKGGDPLAGPLPEGPDGIPTMIADPSATQDLSGAARELISKLDRLVSDDSALHRSLDNIEAFTVSLKNNSERFDRIMSGLEGMTGSADKPGELVEAVKSIRLAADNLDKRIDEMAPGIDALHRCRVEEPRSPDIGCAAGGLDGRNRVSQHRPKSVPPAVRGRAAAAGVAGRQAAATATTRRRALTRHSEINAPACRISNECAGLRVKTGADRSRRAVTIYSMRPAACASMV